VRQLQPSAAQRFGSLSRCNRHKIPEPYVWIGV
jgi:hypothetical protein